MNLERPLVVRALMGASVIVLVIGLIGLATVDDDDSPANLAAGDRTTTTAVSDTTAPSDTTTTAVVGGTSTTASRAPTTRPPASTTTVASARVPDPGPTKPPAAGTYMYKFVYADDPSRNSDITLQVEVQPDQAGSPRRKETYPDGQGNQLSNDVTYASDAVRITASHIVSSQATVDCTWNPSILVLVLPLALDKGWSYDSRCTASVSGAQVTIRRKGENKVIGKALDIVGTTSVRTWVIEEKATTTVSSAFFNTTREATVTRHWSPENGLITFEKEVGTNNGQAYTTERTLQNVKPK